MVEDLGRHAQSVEPRVHPRRIVGRVVGLARLGHIDHRDRLRHRRLDPDSGLDLRPRTRVRINTTYEYNTVSLAEGDVAS